MTHLEPPMVLLLEAAAFIVGCAASGLVTYAKGFRAGAKAASGEYTLLLEGIGDRMLPVAGKEYAGALAASCRARLEAMGHMPPNRGDGAKARGMPGRQGLCEGGHGRREA